MAQGGCRVVVRGRRTKRPAASDVAMDTGTEGGSSQSEASITIGLASVLFVSGYATYNYMSWKY